MSATLGGLIKDLRIQKNISQLEIAFALGWKEPSRLSRIEQGRNTAPPRFLIENIMDAMKLSEEERNQLLLIGNYLPTKEDVEKLRIKIAPIIDSWPFPATCVDYTWRIVYSNQNMYHINGINYEQQQILLEQLPNIIDVIFKTDFTLNTQLNELQMSERKSFLLRTLIHFVYDQKNRTTEKWYSELIKLNMDNPLFRNLWIEALRRSNEGDVMNYGRQNFYKNTQTLTLDFFRVPVFGDPRFIVTFFTPHDIETFQYFNK